MKFLDEQFKDLEEELKITNQAKEQLRSKILNSNDKGKKRNIMRYSWVVVAVCLLFLITSPFYSTTMASIASRILPISITPTYSNGQHNPDLTAQLFELVEGEGYKVNSVGVTPNPYTIDVSLFLEDSTLKQAIETIEPKIKNYLFENGYDKYELKFSAMAELPADPPEEETFDLYDQVREIVKDVFTSYGYAEEADFELAGLKSGLFSNVVTIDMPDHIKESAEIIEELRSEFKAQNLKIKDIEVYTFNLKHRQQDNRWGYVASDIHNGMAGKSTYQVTGVSYKVKKGHSYVWLKTDFNEPPSSEIIQEIELAIKEYLALPETKEQIQNDDYTIQLLLKDKQPFIEITK